jgi:DNA-binding transcriptional LysR family regulator
VLGIADLAAHRTGAVTCACVRFTVWHFLPELLKEFSGRYPRIWVRIHDESAQAGRQDGIVGVPLITAPRQRHIAHKYTLLYPVQNENRCPRPPAALTSMAIRHCRGT